MKTYQTNIFDRIGHRENNAESQQHYDDNQLKFSRKCRDVFKLLFKGHRLTVLSALVNHGISSLPRRILDLKEHGIKITDNWTLDDNGKRQHKQWFMSDSDREHNKAVINGTNAS